MKKVFQILMFLIIGAVFSGVMFSACGGGGGTVDERIEKIKKEYDELKSKMADKSYKLSNDGGDVKKSVKIFAKFAKPYIKKYNNLDKKFTKLLKEKYPDYDDAKISKELDIETQYKQIDHIIINACQYLKISVEDVASILSAGEE
jgi:hypothetical protein